MAMILNNGLRDGVVTPPPSKSHLHRLLIADFLAGGRAHLSPSPDDSADIAATRRCLRALAEDGDAPVLDCDESGSTLRFLRPIAAALGKHPRYVLRGRLAKRPGLIYDTLEAGLHELPGDVSSQFATGLLFALPLVPATPKSASPRPSNRAATSTSLLPCWPPRALKSPRRNAGSAFRADSATRAPHR